MKFAVATTLLILAALCGCTAGEPDNDASMASITAPPPPDPAGYEHFEGIWQGMLTSDLSGNSSDAVVLVNGWGEFRLIADGAQFVGWPRRTATSIAGTVTGIRAAGNTWNDGSQSSEFDLDGTISEHDFIEARYTGGGESGVMALARGSYPESHIDSIVGTWAQYDDNENIMATFQIGRRNMWQANIYGSDASGCTYSGETEAWTSRYSYDVVPLEASGCPPVAGLDLNGTYSGTGALVNRVDDVSEETALVIALSGDDLQHQVTFFLYRISE